MSGQTQKVSGQAIAVQSAGDTTINQGLTRHEMKAIIEDTIAAQLPAFTAVAREIADARLTEFKERILERFVELEKARREAFKDPDFQYLLGRAEHAFARSGDQTVRETLIDLIVQRSKQKDRTRLALSLNEAVERAAVLTHNEFAELSLTYLLKHTRNLRVANLDDFANFLNTHIAPLLPDVSTEYSSYTYLQSQSCATIVNFSRVDLLTPFRDNYGGALAKGVTAAQIRDHLPDAKKDIFEGTTLIVPCLNDNTKFQYNAINKDAFKEQVQKAKLALSHDELDNLWNALQATMWSKEEMIQNLSPKVPSIGELFRLWESTPLNHLDLTPVGIAIGHGNLVRLVKLEADLSIWIK